jgi:hypothetical protein
LRPRLQDFTQRIHEISKTHQKRSLKFEFAGRGAEAE